MLRRSAVILVLVCSACRADADDPPGAEAGEASSGGGGTSAGASTGSSTSGESSDDSSGDESSGESGSTGEPPTECPEPVDDPPCEAVGAGRCFYIDPMNGDDAGDGSAAAPWRSFVNVNSSIYYGVYPPAPQWVALGPGDFVYVREGTIDRVFHPGDDSGPDGGGSFVLVLRGVEGPVAIKGWPGERPVIAPAEDAVGVYVLQSSGVSVEGLEVRDAYDRGILIEESQDVEVARVLVYDTDGTANDNIAGLEILGSSDVVVRDSVFADNYDRAAAEAGAQTHNSGNLVMFSNSGAIAIRRCAFYQSEGPDSQFSGFGVKYKHASRDPEATFELSESYFEGTVFAFAIGTAHADLHHNVVVQSGIGYWSADLGGPTHQWDQRLRENTIVAGVPILVSPSLDWVDHDNGPWPDVTANAIEGNIVVDTSREHVGERRTVVFDPYMDDARHDALAAGIELSGNCWSSAAGAASFGFAEAENYGAAGGAFDLAGWRDAYGFDLDSVEADPELVDSVPDAASPCASMGAFVDGHAPAIGLADPLACGDAALVRRWE